MKLHLTKLYGLIYDCPFKETEKDCPFTKFRNIENFKERLNALNQVTPSKAVELMNHHKNCLTRRENITKTKQSKMED